jgi:hypothetical protein
MNVRWVCGVPGVGVVFSRGFDNGCAGGAFVEEALSAAKAAIRVRKRRFLTARV